MPNIKSAKKRMVLSATARVKNRAERSRIRTAIKQVRAAETAEAGTALYKDAVKLLDRAATRIARIKSGLARHINALA